MTRSRIEELWGQGKGVHRFVHIVEPAGKVRYSCTAEVIDNHYVLHKSLGREDRVVFGINDLSEGVDIVNRRLYDEVLADAQQVKENLLPEVHEIRDLTSFANKSVA